ncbi:MAG TPA: magnesium chelatase ATPase subunit I [Pyrinomonadaceae bacterium]|nr:magnesium chelatase ATPase subunit I [Pyrinomonadaceae bacterium]
MKRRAPLTEKMARTPVRAKPPVYPFTAIVGQDEMKLALLLNVIDPTIGGVLIMGHRGTGKSTAVRALADLLPEIQRVRDCLYGCDPADEALLCDDCFARLSSGEKLAQVRSPVGVADLPLGATEDRVCGTINIERALSEGLKTFEPGLLARANRGFLYIDEVNLLEDHLIDLLLDVAVTGRNVVEREGVSVEHPARFVLVGSGNPEEGELRPQLLDRFGLHTEVRTAADPEERVRIVERRDAFDRDAEGFRAEYESEQEALRRRLVRARKGLRQVKLARELLHRIAELCGQLKVDGHRGELTIARAARALAAFEGRKSVGPKDVRRVATMALRHRLRRDPLEQTGSGARVEQQLDKLLPMGASDVRRQAADTTDEDEPKPLSSPTGGRDDDGAGGMSARTGKGADGAPSNDARRETSPPPIDASLPEVSLNSLAGGERGREAQTGSARRRSGLSRSQNNARGGRYVRAQPLPTAEGKVALDATLRAAAQAMESKRSEEGEERPTVSIPAHALRYKRFKRKAGTLFIFAVDTSGSMALNRIAQAKGALVRLLQRSYIKRDRVALVSFCGQGADVHLGPSASAARARRILDTLSVGGATPLGAGLACALGIARRARGQQQERIVLFLFTDGRANISLAQGEALSRAARQSAINNELEVLGAALKRIEVRTVVVDTQNRFASGGEARKLAVTLGASYVYLPTAATAGAQFDALVHQAEGAP